MLLKDNVFSELKGIFSSTHIAGCVEPFCLAAFGSEIGVCTTVY